MNTNTNYAPVSAAEMAHQASLIEALMKEVMEVGVHYGTIPNLSQRACLFKPGAEVLLSAFRISGKPEIQNLSSANTIHYLVCLHGHHLSGNYVGCGVGECSSNEDKYQWVRAKSKGEFDAALECNRRVKWNYDGTHDLMVRSNPFNYSNTILKIAKKRALVDLALTATAASQFFTQDLDDMELPLADGDATPATKPKAATPNVPAASPFQDTITKITNESRDNWTRFDIFTGQGFKMSTFTPEIMRQAQSHAGTNVPVTLRWGKSEKGFLDLFEVIAREAPPAQGGRTNQQAATVIQPPSRSQALADARNGNRNRAVASQ